MSSTLSSTPRAPATPIPAADVAQPDPTEPRARIAALDGVRGLAIFLVLIYHMTCLPEATWLDGFWFRLTSIGWCGVSIFFVLSGFLITGILVDAREDPHYFRNFYARRVLRIFPLYYAIVFLSLVILPGLLPAEKAERFGRVSGEGWWYWTYLSNFLIAKHSAFRHGILDVSWSLAIEEQFYLMWPAVVYLLSRRTLGWVCAVMVIGALVMRCIMVASGVSYLQTYVITPSHFDGLAIGALLALAVRRPSGLQAFRPLAYAIVALVPAALLIAAVRWNLNWETWYMSSFGFTPMALVGGAIIVLVLTTGRWAAAFSNPVARMFGKYSYALYLIHMPIRAVVRDMFYGPTKFFTIAGSTLPGQIVFYTIGIAICVPVAWLSWNLFEKHFLKLKVYFEHPTARDRGRKITSG